MKSILIILISLMSNFIISQNDTLYLMIDKPKFGVQNYNSINTGFAIKSNDKRFHTDYFNFGVFNFYWSDSKQDIDYYKLSEMKKEVNIDTISYKTINELKKNKKWWEIHNELSLKRKIFLLEKINTDFNSSTGKYNFKWYSLPVMYLGTRKNTVPTDLSLNKN